MHDKIITIGLIQSRTCKDTKITLHKTAKFVENAAKKGAKIICLQELYKTLYFPQYPHGDKNSYAETIPGESTVAFSKLAKKYKIVIVVPVFEKSSNGKYYNSAVVIDANGKLLDVYHKTHIPQDPLFYEKNYFEQGASNYKVYKTKYAKIGVLICYDQWFPEAARILALKGAEIIFYPTAIGTIKGHKSKDGDWHDAWETVMRGHAIANTVHVAAVNRVGAEDQLKFWGQSFVCDSFGKILKRASNNKEEVLICRINLSNNKRIQDGWGFFRNRRRDTYGDLIKK